MVNSMKGSIVFVVLSALLLLAACTPKMAPPAQPVPAAQPASIAQAPPAVQQQAEPATADAAVSSIDTTSAQVDQLDKEFDTTSLDEVDKDLQSIDNLDFG